MQPDFGVNAGLVEELYGQYLDNPESVDPSWRAHFSSHGGPRLAWGGPGAPPNPAEPSLGGPESPPNPPEERRRSVEPRRGGSVDLDRGAREPPQTSGEQDGLVEGSLQARVYALLNAYRVRGHLFAHVDPLGLPPPAPAELDLGNFRLRPQDLDRPFHTVDLAGLPAIASLREMIVHLEETYCRSIGVEFTHIDDREQRLWLQTRMESSANRLPLGRAEQLRILTKLTDAEIFEQFIHKSYEAGTKRFSLEGAESLIPLLDLVIERAASHGVDELVIGMAHRGRLNVLANTMEKSLREIFAAFEDADADRYLGSGDVKYHQGYSSDKRLDSGKTVHLTLTFNPSHLEFVDPVVEGRVRAKQDRRADADARRRIVPLLIHGDAAFMGQGVVAETLNLSGIEGYATGGTVHLIVNNQIGFTTNPSDSRSTRYATDITRMLKVPVLHVNGEDPEAVAQVACLAVDFRDRFGKDVVIDMFCYRRYGHNEGDEPRYTQPRMYAAIDRKPTVRQVYVKRLVEMGQVSEEQAEDLVRLRREVLAAALDEVKRKGFAPSTYAMGGVWKSYRGGPDAAAPEVATGVPAERLIELSQRMLELPKGFKAHPKVLAILKARHDKLAADAPFDWATGEMLAYATLLADRTPVRLSGQDARRGTFSHRHSFVVDLETGESFAPAWNVTEKPGRFEVYNSPLSEQGVLGFDFGYSLDYPDALVVWEAQFGDFLNGAQVIVDQFLTSSEDKWHRLSGLVLYLPHGFEGQGPEHSSARVERFLQDCAEDNIQVVAPTTPAQLFHVLRRQVLRPWRKPLVVLTPKSMLRVPATSKGPHRPVSTLSDLANGHFQRVIPDTSGVDPSDVKRVLLCSGKVYYDLATSRERRGITDVAILRLEQLYPYNEALIEALAPYKSGTRVVWVQEEPRNYGAWYFVNANLTTLVGDRFPVSCVARAPSASPATGSKASHLLEQKMLLDEAFA